MPPKANAPALAPPSADANDEIQPADGDDSDATICISDDGGGVDGVFDVFQDNGSDEDELN